MDVQKVEQRVIEIDSNYYLMQVFNAVNQERNTLAFVYHGVKFWREEYVFML